MTKIQFFYKAQSFLKRVIRSRKAIIAKHVGHRSEEASMQEIRNMEYALEMIKDAATMRKYIHRKKVEIRLLIPARHQAWFNELEDLLDYDPAEMKLEFNL